MKTILVDDEKNIRQGLRILLQKTTLEVLAEAATLEEAKSQIETLQPEIVFLDIKLHQHTGFELLDQLDYLDFHLVFITAYNEYAIKAFKYNAFDYLLKPIDTAELYDTIKRIKQQNINTKNQLNTLKSNTDNTHIVIKTTQQLYKIALKDIVRCEADQGYTHFYLNNGTHVLSSKTLKEYHNLFPDTIFLRVHQSHLVNWHYVQSFTKNNILILKNNKEVPVSVRKKQLVKERLRS